MNHVCLDILRNINEFTFICRLRDNIVPDCAYYFELDPNMTSKKMASISMLLGDFVYQATGESLHINWAYRSGLRYLEIKTKDDAELLVKTLTSSPDIWLNIIPDDLKFILDGHIMLDRAYSINVPYILSQINNTGKKTGPPICSCPYCGGSGKLELLTSVVECDCVKANL